ncbi:MAG: 50S ribosomal protein L6 [Oligoflexia bacterium]|nr:50S ribosomal protein L6 [Oligoflexia bacterium]
MSRIGKQKIKIPSGVKVNIQSDVFNFEGPKGKLSHKLPKGVTAKVESDHIVVSKDNSVENSGALYGLTRTLLANCVHGVHAGYTKGLEINGVGYRAAVQGQNLNLTLGFSHPVIFTLPQGITGKVDQNTKVTITGADKQLVGSVCAKIKGIKPVEPYQGKGIRYAGEYVRKKAGKAAGAGK